MLLLVEMNIPKFQCKSCTTFKNDTCNTGYYLKDCGGSSSGACHRCTNKDDSNPRQYYTSNGRILNNENS